jgi:hypothetical protein
MSEETTEYPRTLLESDTTPEFIQYLFRLSEKASTIVEKENLGDLKFQCVQLHEKLYCVVLTLSCELEDEDENEEREEFKFKMFAVGRFHPNNDSTKPYIGMVKLEKYDNPNESMIFQYDHEMLVRMIIPL